MNCTQCNTEIPSGASFCPQCGMSTANKPIFPSDPHDQQPTGQYNLLIGCLCLLGASLMIAMFIGAACFNTWFSTMPVSMILKRSYTEPVGNLSVGDDLNLYGKTVEDEDFDWESLRGKYVLVKFTATWCPPCKMEIPGMQAIYEKYRDKDLEIVSVYMWQGEPNAADTVKQYVAKEKLPWIILSEPLTLKEEQPEYRDSYAIRGVPAMLLVDKEGKVLLTNVYTRDGSLQEELKKLLEE